MDITDIRIKKVESDNKLKAYVTVTFDNCFVVHNLKIRAMMGLPTLTSSAEAKEIQHPALGRRQVVSHRILVPAFRRFESCRPSSSIK
jgi:DNA-binding cell septation regulator SpoVG